MVKQSESPDLSRSEVEDPDPSGMAQAYLTEPEPKAPGLVPGVTLVPGVAIEPNKPPILERSGNPGPSGQPNPPKIGVAKKHFRINSSSINPQQSQNTCPYTHVPMRHSRKTNPMGLSQKPTQPLPQ
jgi:hypothetical protein